MFVVIHKAPGFAEEFQGSLIPGLHEVRVCDDVEPMTVISTADEESLAVGSRYVFTPDGLDYAKEWSVKSGKSVHEVYLPEALRVPADYKWKA